MKLPEKDVVFLPHENIFYSQLSAKQKSMKDFTKVWIKALGISLIFLPCGLQKR